MEYPDGSYTENVYDYEYGIKKLQRQLQYGNDGELVEETLYSYDDGHRLDVEYVTKQNLFIRCKYDDLNRVTPRQMILTTCGPIENEYFTYDDAGNMTQMSLNEERTILIYDSQNRLTKAGNNAYTYDAEDYRIKTVLQVRTKIPASSSTKSKGEGEVNVLSNEEGSVESDEPDPEEIQETTEEILSEEVTSQDEVVINEEVTTEEVTKEEISTREVISDNRFDMRPSIKLEELTTLEELTELGEEYDMEATTSTSVKIVTSEYCYDR